MTETKKKISFIVLVGIVVVLSFFILKQIYFLSCKQNHFLWLAVAAPLLGGLFRLRGVAAFVGLFLGVKWLLGSVPITFGIPTACAAAYWSLFNCNKGGLKMRVKHLFISLGLPVICVFFFVAHPVGKQAFLYSFYWFIPIIIFFVQRFFGSSFLLCSLGSVFISHAVGSVMSLYITPTVPEKWIGLIPVVAVERLSFAAGAFFVAIGVKYAIQVISLRFQRYKKSDFVQGRLFKQ